MIYSPDKDIEGDSKTYKNWISVLTLTTCFTCRKLHGTIYPINEPPYTANIHVNCNCSLVPMRTKELGHVTEDCFDGADVYISCLGKLPENYIGKTFAQKNGWISYRGNLREVLPGATIGGDVYKNRENKLPSAPGRIWYEADIDYNGGFRNQSRLLFSDDGLLFATYDHYQTFYEILQ